MVADAANQDATIGDLEFEEGRDHMLTLFERPRILDRARFILAANQNDNLMGTFESTADYRFMTDVERLESSDKDEGVEFSTDHGTPPGNVSHGRPVTVTYIA
jgi:hypothetical protein